MKTHLKPQLPNSTSGTRNPPLQGRASNLNQAELWGNSQSRIMATKISHCSTSYEFEMSWRRIWPIHPTTPNYWRLQILLEQQIQIQTRHNLQTKNLGSQYHDWNSMNRLKNPPTVIKQIQKGNKQDPKPKFEYLKQRRFRLKWRLIPTHLQLPEKGSTLLSVHKVWIQTWKLWWD